MIINENNLHFILFSENIYLSFLKMFISFSRTLFTSPNKNLIKNVRERFIFIKNFIFSFSYFLSSCSQHTSFHVKVAKAPNHNIWRIHVIFRDNQWLDLLLCEQTKILLPRLRSQRQTTTEMVHKVCFRPSHHRRTFKRFCIMHVRIFSHLWVLCAHK